MIFFDELLNSGVPYELLEFQQLFTNELKSFFVFSSGGIHPFEFPLNYFQVIQEQLHLCTQVSHRLIGFFLLGSQGRQAPIRFLLGFCNLVLYRICKKIIRTNGSMPFRMELDITGIYGLGDPEVAGRVAMGWVASS